MTQVTLQDSDPLYEAPLFKFKDGECSKGEDFVKTEYYGLEFGSCHPTVDKGSPCPAAPTGTPKQGGASTDGKKVRCVLPCTSDSDCDTNQTCATKGSSGICVIYNQDTHHNWDAPFSDHGCKESIEGDGVAAVFFTKTAGGKAGICAPRARDGQCFAQDYPESAGPSKVKAIKDESGDQYHCQLVCNDKVCMDGSSCTLTTSGQFCLYDNLQPGKGPNPPGPEPKPPKPGPPGPKPDPPGPNPPGPKPKPGGHHTFETPYSSKKGGALKCSEHDADAVEFETADSTLKKPKKAGICAPQPKDGACPADDHPEGSTAVPKSVKDGSGSHCELDCSSGQKCPKGTYCTSVKTPKSQLFAMRLEDGGDMKLCLYKEGDSGTSKPWFKNPIILGAIGGGVLAVIAIILIYCCCCKKKDNKDASRGDSDPFYAD